MSEEQNEVLEQQRYLLERRMYRLDPAPPKLPAQEYIVRYLTEKRKSIWFGTSTIRNLRLINWRRPSANDTLWRSILRTSNRRRCAVSWSPFKCTTRLLAHRLPLFKRGICRTAWVTISARRKAVLSP